MFGIAREVWFAIGVFVVFLVVPRLMRRIPNPFRLAGFAALVILLMLLSRALGQM